MSYVPRVQEEFEPIQDLEQRYGLPFKIELRYDGVSYLVEVTKKESDGRYVLVNAITKELIGYAIGGFQAKDVRIENSVCTSCECGADICGIGYHSEWCPKSS